MEIYLLWIVVVRVADPSLLENGVIIVIAALIAAFAWNLITWWLGIPSSSSHALIGSLTGAVIGGAGVGHINGSGLFDILQALIFSPLIAFALGITLMTLFKLIFASSSPHTVNRSS